MDKASFEDTIQREDVDDTLRLDKDSDTAPQLDNVYDFTRQLNGTIRLEKHPENLVVPVAWSLLPMSSDFARLVPVNHQAKIAFHKIATTLNTESSWNSHCRKFIHVSDISDTELHDIYTGCFRPNLGILPDQIPQGWVIEAGRPGMDHLGVDFLLTIKGNWDRVRGRHASIKHHLVSVSRQLMIAPGPGKAVVLNGEELSTDGRVLERVCMGLAGGNLTFKVDFLRTNATSYNGQLNEIIQESRTW